MEYEPTNQNTPSSHQGVVAGVVEVHDLELWVLSKTD